MFTAGTVTGTIAGTVNSSDNSGIQSASLYVDGTPVSQQTSACNYTLPAPCPASSSNQFSLNTTTLPNGVHTIQAAVLDAAANQTMSGPVQITVDNPSTTTGQQPNPSGNNGGSGSGKTAQPPAPASPELRIDHVRRTTRALHVAGSAAPTLAGTLTIVVRYRYARFVSQARARARAREASRTIRVAHGGWGAILRLPAGALTVSVTVLHRASPGWLAQTVVRDVHHRTRPPT